MRGNAYCLLFCGSIILATTSSLKAEPSRIGPKTVDQLINEGTAHYKQIVAKQNRVVDQFEKAATQKLGRKISFQIKEEPDFIGGVRKTRVKFDFLDDTKTQDLGPIFRDFLGEYERLVDEKDHLYESYSNLSVWKAAQQTSDMGTQAAAAPVHEAQPTTRPSTQPADLLRNGEIGTMVEETRP